MDCMTSVQQCDDGLRAQLNKQTGMELGISTQWLLLVPSKKYTLKKKKRIWLSSKQTDGEGQVCGESNEEAASNTSLYNQAQKHESLSLVAMRR